ncbi:hypothetical protein VTL71DRAFT_14839 [Oculimacula yallundae]|uniref:Prion-inhibition and propagation HeLo domain-containing protein n=1 Tax=Oculimacula yallundae TaxID=86028 RepID=A0ABR4CFP0_9HELO
MEPVTFTIGVVGLVGTFTACVDCFEHFRIGQHFGKDYETCVVKLDLVRLRLTRWGASVGISRVDEDVAIAQLRSRLHAPEETFSTVMGVLVKILKHFERTAEISNRWKIRLQRNHTLQNEQYGFHDKSLESLHGKIKQLVVRRQKASTPKQETQWTIYRKQEFTKLIEVLTDFVTALVDLVPAAEQTHMQMCDAELSEIGNDQSLVILDKILPEPVADDNEGEDSGSDDGGNDELLVDRIFRKKVVDLIDERRGTMPKTEWLRNITGDGSTICPGMQGASHYTPECIRPYPGEIVSPGWI